MATLTITDIVDGANAFCGGTLSSSHSGFDSPPSVYQWKRNGIIITGATSPGYGTKFLDIGQSLTCTATGRVSGITTDVTSNAVIVQPPRAAIIPFPLPSLPGKITLSTVDSVRYELKIGGRHYGSFQTDGYGLPTLANTIAYRFKRRLFDASFLEDTFGGGLAGLPEGAEVAPEIGGVASAGEILTLTPMSGVTSGTIMYEWYYSDDNFVTAPIRLDVEFFEQFRLTEELVGKWVRVKAIISTWTGDTISVREIWSNILGPITPAGGAVFDPPALTDGGTAFGSWTASTEADVGGSPTLGYDENVIANWTVPTLDVIKAGETKYIGVIARHMNGIAKVQFSLNNGPWVDVLTESSNPDSLGSGRECTAYWCKINAADLTVDKLIEIRAKCIPQTAGIPRILQGAVTTTHTYTGSGTQYTWSMVVYNAKNGYEHPTDPIEVYCGDFGLGTPNDTNNGLTKSTPVATLKQAYYRLGGNVGGGSAAHDISGKTVWLGAGSFNHEGYGFGTKMQSDKAFVHVRKDPAIDRENCIYNGEHYSTDTSGLRMQYVAIHDMLIKPRAGTYLNGSLDSIDIYGSTYGPCFKNTSQGILWLDGCKFTSPYTTSTFDGTHNSVDHPNPGSSANINSLQCPTAEGWTSGWKTTIVTRPYVNYSHGTPCLGLCTMHTTLDYCAEDITRNSMIAYDVVATNVRFLTTEHHPDVWQSYLASGTIANQICMKVVAVDGVGAQGFFCHGDTVLFRDIWLENWRVRNDNNGTDYTNYGDTLSCMQWQQPLRHVVCKDIIFRCEQAGFLLYRAGAADSDFTAKNVILWGVYLVTTDPLTANPVTADTAIFQTFGGSALGTWPGTLPWTEPTTGIVYKAL